jgi:hypothetical protein
MAIKRTEPGPFRSLAWGWDQAVFISSVSIIEAFNKRNEGTRVWQTDASILIYVLEGRLQVEPWANVNGLGRLDRFKPMVRLEKGESVHIDAATTFRMIGITDAKYLMMGSDNLLGKLTALPIDTECPSTAMPEAPSE